MEEIITQTDKLLSMTLALGEQRDIDFETFKKKLAAFASNAIGGDRTPNRNKKKKKKLSLLRINESPEITKQNVANAQKNTTTCNTNDDTTSSVSNASLRSSRPRRTAKTQAEKNLIQPSFKQKRRQPSETIPTGSFHIKHERISAASSNSATEIISGKRKSNDSSRGKMQDSLEEPSKKNDDSLQMIMKTESFVTVSDDESTNSSDVPRQAEEMPPPLLPPKKGRARKAAKPEGNPVSTRQTRAQIKKEKLSTDNEASTFSENKQSKTHDEETIVKEKNSTVINENHGNSSQKMSKTGQANAGNNKRIIPNATIKVEIEENQPLSENEQRNQSKATGKDNKNLTTESVYEDAVCSDSKQLINNETEKSASNTTKILPPKPHQQAETNHLHIADATFVSVKEFCNSTFIAPASKDQNAPNPDGYMPVPTVSSTDFNHPSSNVTFCLNKTVGIKANGAHDQNALGGLSENSLLTDDNSTTEDEALLPPRKKLPLPTKINHKELFNPCVESPVMKKVQAFEKHASALASPHAQQRPTRTRTQLKENQNPEGKLSNKHQTPPILSNRAIFLTPSGQPNTTPLMGTLLMKRPISATKSNLPFRLPSSARAAPASSVRLTSSRDNSVEDLKRGLVNKTQQMEEKKRMREQKQLLAQQSREMKDKLRAEKLQKAIAEREEKCRRKAEEIESKRQDEEHNKQLKAQEEKREMQKRMEKQRQMEQEQNEASRKERAVLDEARLLKTKHQLQQKLRENEMIIKCKKKDKNRYTFDMLNSDDSTDDENKVSKRPLPPGWSRPAERRLFIERQSNLDTKIIDNFFSVKPLTPDLRDIFPAINPLRLKRNSSVFWNTPPRYSQMPKY